MNATFCEGFEGLFASLRPLCPETCGCLDAKFELSHDCPLSCKEDIVRARVAFLGCPSFLPLHVNHSIFDSKLSTQKDKQ